ncbi:MAG: energy-dependent translational throttle protein EttA, partial [Pseudomonadota bacterium]|nr:energy-dependent translational throttle protein EttA [Pseudomonadota bacterium]
EALIASMGDTHNDEAMHKLQALQSQLEAADAWQLRTRVETTIAQLGLQPGARIGSLSGGLTKRVALAQALVGAPDILLLDEPTNHLDAESVAWLEHYLENFSGTVVAITHDRYFLDNAAGWILELDRGRGIPYEGNYSSWLEAKEKRIEQEQRQEASYQKAIKAELEWVRSNPKGRQAKNKARLQRFEELNSQEFQSRNETNEIYIPPGARLGDKVIEVNGLRKAFDDRLLFEDVSFVVPKGSIVGIIGANGMGKSTLFRVLMGLETPDGGEVVVGDTVELGYVDQSRDDLDGSKTVWEEVSDGLDIIRIGNYEIPSRSYLGRFNFKGSDQQKFVKDLSGGERNRLHLAKLLKQGANVLLLDEPTNDLDVETLRALEEALLAFPGSALVISHDRWFLDRIATHVLAYENDSSVVFHEGNYSEYEENYRQRVGSEAAVPSRVKHRKLK